MTADKKDTFSRIAGMAGLILLLCLILWARRGIEKSSQGDKHDHADPAMHGNDMQMKSLNSGADMMIPSGRVENGTRIVEYDAFQYNFSPDPLIVRAGEKVRLLVKSRDVLHGLVIPDIDFSIKIPVGNRSAKEFKAPAQPGEYSMFCNVFCGSDHGNMKGRLVVLPSDSNKKSGHHDK